MRDTIDGINEKAWERAMATPDPTPQADVLHIELLGHPSQAYPRTRMAECGRYYHVREFAPHVDQVTCPACRAAIERRAATKLDALPPLKPGDLPKPMSRKERRALDRIDHAALAYERPNVDPTRDRYDTCSQSRFGRHSFATRGGVLLCTFCRRHEADCRRPR